MKITTSDYSVEKFSPKLIAELKDALQAVNAYGSVEVYIQDNKVTQITVRSIKKTLQKSTNGNGNGHVA